MGQFPTEGVFCFPQCGWLTLSTYAEPGWGQTIEDVMGPFEHWATPKGHLIEMAAEPKTGAVPRPTSPSITEPMSPPATSSVKAAATPEEQQSSQSHCEV